MSSLLDAPPAKNSAAPYVAVVGTIAAHGAIVILASLFGARAISEVRKALSVTEMVEVDLPPPPPPPPAEKPVVEPVTRPVVHQQAAATPPPEPPAAAQAAEVLDAKAEAVDFGDMVVGTGDAFAGGTTDSKGTSTTAVRDTAARGAAPPPVVRAPAAPAVDLSRPPQLAGGARWDCPFPLEADDAGLDHAVVTLRVDVGSDGGVQRVSIVSDPGNGFGREARRCAGSKRWQAAVDRTGHPLAAAATVNVRFDR